MNDKKQDKKKSIIFTIIVFILIAILGFLAVFSCVVEEKNYSNSEIALNGENQCKNNYIISNNYFSYEYDFTGARVVNDNTSYIFDNAFNEGYSYWSTFYFGYDYINEFLTAWEDFDVDNFNPSVSLTCSYVLETNEGASEYIGNIKLSYWTLPTYFDSSTQFNSWFGSVVPNDFYTINISSQDYYNGYSTYYFTITYYFPFKNLISNNALGSSTYPTFVIPSYIYSDVNAFSIRSLGFDLQDYSENCEYIFGSIFYDTPDISNSVTINQLYNSLDALQQENSRLQGENLNLQSQYNLLDIQYNALLDQYNLILQNDYTFSELFWSISAVPFGVLTSTFNVNVMGVNLAGVITGLLTSMVLLWLIKRLFK